MVELTHRYLWAAKGRGGKLYWYYRRDGQRVPLKSQDGRRLVPNDIGFLESYERIHASFESTGRDAPGVGTLAHVIEQYRASPEFKQLAERTRKDYARYLDQLQKTYGTFRIATMPREFVRKLRDKHQDKPRTANYLVQVLRLLLTFAEDQPMTFRLPQGWRNPARKPRLLRTGSGHRPWEEYEIAAFRRRWKPDTFERVAFELALNTGQRGQDVVAMTRQQYHHGEISIVQKKTGTRVEMPVSKELLEVLDPWLEGHHHMMILPTTTGRPCKVDHFRHVMRAAYRAANLPEECTTHGLRYTAATILRELGCDWQVIADITGHQTQEMARKYSEKQRRSKLAIKLVDAARAGRNGNME